MRLPALAAVVAVALLATACEKATEAPAPDAALQAAVSPPRAVVSVPVDEYAGVDPWVAATEATPASAADPAPERLAPAQAPAAPRASPLDTMRFDGSSPEAMASALQAFGNASTPEEERLVQQALLVALLSSQEQLTTEAAAGRTIQLDEQTLFRRTFGHLHGKTYRAIYAQMAPLLPKYQQAYLQSRWAAGAGPQG